MERISTTDLLTNTLGISAERQDFYHSQRLGVVMRKLGWDGPKKIRLPNRKRFVQGYERPYQEPEGGPNPMLQRPKI
jgi:hypothetical protein